MKQQKHPQSPPPIALDDSFGVPVCGIDEVGRGPLAGPVVAACAFIPPDVRDHPVWGQVTDSKKLTAKKREFLFPVITSLCIYGIAEISAQEIDELNIHHATLRAMKKAFEAMPDHGAAMALVDGKFIPAIPCPAKAIVKGDSLSRSIGVASIIAKVYRDRLMAVLHDEFPAYGWARNAGYGTAEHMAAIQAHGVTAYHRRSFAPCAG